MKKIIVFLSSKPTDGGKFQYGLSIVNGLESLISDGFIIYALYLDKQWKDFIPEKFNQIQLSQNNKFVKLLKKIITNIPQYGNLIWRRFGKYMDKYQKNCFEISPDLIIYTSRDELIHEMKLPGVVPIFDLMHKYENFPELNEGGINKKREIYYNLLCKYAKKILVDSTVGKSHLLESYKVDEEKIEILPFTIPPYIYHQTASEKSKTINFPKNYVFYPAQFWLHKNHLGLIEAINILKLQGILINCVFVGSDYNSLTLINQKIKEYGLQEQIFTFDYVNNESIISLYQNALALVMPSFFGPTNIPQLEAFELGCPVITSRIYGIPEQVGDAALLIDPNNPDEIASNILSLYNNPSLRATLIKKGKIRASELSQKNFNIKLRSIISNIIDKNK